MGQVMKDLFYFGNPRYPNNANSEFDFSFW